MHNMQDYKNPKMVVDSSSTKPAKFSWRSPSNLAIIKYWGKYGQQLPKNPSLSITLQNAFTETTVAYQPRKGKDDGNISLEFWFHETPNELFRQKIQSYLASITDIYPFLRQMDWTIHSRNSFPHSSGIASSASAMSALALCLCSVEKNIFGTLEKDSEFLEKASYLARLGSGSACRSVYPKMAVWGETGLIPGSSNLIAVPYYDGLHPMFQNLHNDILLISKSEKSVSSRAGHGLMDGNIYAENRYTQARQRLHYLTEILAQGDIEVFGQIAEAEALTLHALMMTSNPPYILMKPNTLEAIEKIRDFRNTEKVPLYFSLDAGPNLHLLYPDSAKSIVDRFVQSQLAPLCQNGQWIKDQMGNGPQAF
jgi:diphosphomevalonate decarboxylase